MPPYRDPYEDDEELNEADLGNDFDQDKADASEEEFESSVEDDDDDVSTDDEPTEDDTKEETDETDETDDDEEELDDDSTTDDSEDTTEDSDTPEDDAEDGEPEAENQIPQSRFNEVNGNWRRAEERAERLETLLEQTIAKLGETSSATNEDDTDLTEVDIAAVETEILELAFAGKEKEAVAKRLELDNYKELVWAEKYGKNDVKAEVETLLETRDQDTKLKEVIASSQTQYPVLDKANKNYDQEIVDEINLTWDGLSTRMPTSQALAKAVEFVTAARGMSSVDEGEPSGKAPTKGRKKAAVQKNADAQKRQPPKMRGRSAKDDGLDEVKASKLSDNKLFSMSEKELKRLRGD